MYGSDLNWFKAAFSLRSVDSTRSLKRVDARWGLFGFGLRRVTLSHRQSVKSRQVSGHLLGNMQTISYYIISKSQKEKYMDT